MEPPYPSPTPTWHNDAYDAIKPTALEGAHKGKTVVITGAGSGLGRAIAIAWAENGVAQIFLAGRTKATLDETQKLLPATVKSTVCIVDVISEEDVKKLAEEVKAWDVLVLSHGTALRPDMIINKGVEEQWGCFEGNVKSLLNLAVHFVPIAKPDAALITLPSGSTIFPAPLSLKIHDYQVSKIAQTKLIEYLAAQNPGIMFYAVHPGFVETNLFLTVGADPSALPMDTPELGAHFTCWVATHAGRFLNGRFVFANWDVTELQRLEGKIAQEDAFRIGYPSFPFNAAPGNNWWEVASGKEETN